MWGCIFCNSYLEFVLQKKYLLQIRHQATFKPLNHLSWAPLITTKEGKISLIMKHQGKLETCMGHWIYHFVSEMCPCLRGWEWWGHPPLLTASKDATEGPSGPVVVERRLCEPLNNPTLLSLGGGSHLKRESHPSTIGLVFLGRLGHFLSGCA